MTNSSRLAAAPISEGGTPLSAWEGWCPSFPELELAEAPRLVVAAPHPDDEVLGVGGLCALAVRRGIGVTTLLATDGTGSHPGSPTVDPARLGELRIEESANAAFELGLGPPLRLGLPDGGLADHVEGLAAALAEVLRAGDWCLATWRGDGHPDHEAVGRAAAAACERTGARLVEYPVWMWHWAVPADPAVPWGRARGVPLPPDVLAAKRRAAARFETQIRPLSPDPRDAAVLPTHVLERLCRDEELVFP